MGYERVGVAEEGDIDHVEDHVDETNLHDGHQPNAAVPADDGCIVVKVKSSDDKTKEVSVSANGTVFDLKTKIAAVGDFPPANRQRLICSGRLLEDAKTLVESNVTDGVFIHLVPKMVVDMPITSSVTETVTSGPIQIPQHYQEMLQQNIPVAMPSSNPSVPTFSYEDEYELAVWRYRVRVISMLMLFYYFMSLMTSFSMLFHPNDPRYQGSQFRQVKTDVPLSIADAMENVFGISVALTGLKAAVSDSPLVAKVYFKRMLILTALHFVNLFIWIFAFIHKEIIQVTPRQGKSAEEAQESIQSIVGAMLIVHPILWAAMISVALRYFKTLEERDAIVNPPPVPQAQEPATMV